MWVAHTNGTLRPTKATGLVGCVAASDQVVASQAPSRHHKPSLLSGLGRTIVVSGCGTVLTSAARQRGRHTITRNHSGHRKASSGSRVEGTKPNGAVVRNSPRRMPSRTCRAWGDDHTP
jgi:hypothetical protein